jgi:hypothetical protein
MKLFNLRKKTDYGLEFVFIFFELKQFCLFQSSVSYTDYSSWPYAQIMMGNGRLFGLFCYAWKFGFDFDIIGRTWRV